MNLWSKGLGRLVLDLCLSEHAETVAREDRVELRGTMGAPAYWNYAVQMQQEDALDLLLLKQPAAASFMVVTEGRGRLLRSALGEERRCRAQAGLVLASPVKNTLALVSERYRVCT